MSLATVVLMASTKAFQAFGTSSNLVSRSNYSFSKCIVLVG